MTDVQRPAGRADAKQNVTAVRRRSARQDGEGSGCKGFLGNSAGAKGTLLGLADVNFKEIRYDIRTRLRDARKRFVIGGELEGVEGEWRYD